MVTTKIIVKLRILSPDLKIFPTTSDFDIHSEKQTAPSDDLKLLLATSSLVLMFPASVFRTGLRPLNLLLNADRPHPLALAYRPAHYP